MDESYGAQTTEGKSMKDAVKNAIAARISKGDFKLTESREPQWGPPAGFPGFNQGTRAARAPQHETTLSAGVGDFMKSQLGEQPKYARRPIEQLQLRSSITQLEVAISNVRRLLAMANTRLDTGEVSRLQSAIAELSERMIAGTSNTLRPAIIQAGILESRFIAAADPETGEVLSPENDLGARWRQWIGEAGDPETVDNVANQLSSIPANVVFNNVVAACGMTHDRAKLETLNKAHTFIRSLLT